MKADLRGIVNDGLRDIQDSSLDDSNMASSVVRLGKRKANTTVSSLFSY